MPFRGPAVVFGTCLLQLTLLATPTDNASWSNLSQLTHRATFVFADTKRKCFAGSIDKVTDTAVSLRLADGHKMTIDRANLLRVNYGTFATGVLYSARSSWFDVTALASPRWQSFHPKIAVVEKSGQQYEGRLVSASEDEVFMQSGKERVTLQRPDIKTVSYIIAKPLSSSAQYANNELSFMRVFDPELWPTLFGTRSSLKVQVFDAAASQDDSPVICTNGPWNPNQTGPDLTKH